MQNNEYIKHTLLFIIIFFIGTYIINNLEKKMTASYLDVQSRLLKSKFDTNYKYFKIMSNDIYIMLKENPKVMKNFSQAKDANSSKQVELRQNLYNTLKKRYKRLVNMGVAQLHFHLPDNRSFLRMNSPNKYGDDLSDIRNTIAIANRYHKPTEGFEFGRMAYGFRFIYPLFDKQNNHLGSLGISYSSKQLVSMIVDSFVADAHFLVSKKIIEKTLWKNAKKDYFETCKEHPGFLHDATVHISSNHKTDFGKHVLKSNLITKIKDGFETQEPFALSTEYNYQSIVLNFLPIKKSIENEPLAYITTYGESNYLENLKLEIRHNRILFYSILGVVFIFGFFAINSRKALYKIAHNDTLTNLPNRRSFFIESELERDKADRLDNHLALIFIDLDGFKAINDTYGHDVGDEVLIEVAKRIQSCVRKTDIPARLGGDEFAILLCGLEKNNNAYSIAKKLVNEINKPFKIKNHILNIGASIGISFYPDNAKDINKLMILADEMMYEAKKSDNDSIKVYQT